MKWVIAVCFGISFSSIALGFSERFVYECTSDYHRHLYLQLSKNWLGGKSFRISSSEDFSDTEWKNLSHEQPNFKTEGITLEGEYLSHYEKISLLLVWHENTTLVSPELVSGEYEGQLIRESTSGVLSGESDIDLITYNCSKIDHG